MYQAPLGSLDGSVEQAWRAALQMPQHPRFQLAAEITLSFYQSQGYDLNAEQVLRQALAAVPQTGIDARRNLTFRLAAYFESTQQLIKALALREEMEQQPRSRVNAGHVPPRTYEITALANLYERMGEFEKDSNWAGVIDEHKRMLARTENATGPKSRETLNALRELAFAYPPANDWPEEERVLARLLELTVRLSGRSSLDHAHVLVHTANRASQNRRFDQALAWIDQAIEIVRALPDGDRHVPPMMQNRAQILQASAVRQAE